MHVTKTSRLVIRHFAIDDAGAMEAVICDPEVMRYSEGKVQPPQFVRVWVANTIDYFRHVGSHRESDARRDRVCWAEPVFQSLRTQ